MCFDCKTFFKGAFDTLGSQKSLLISTKVINGSTSAPDLTEVESAQMLGWQQRHQALFCPFQFEFAVCAWFVLNYLRVMFVSSSSLFSLLREALSYSNQLSRFVLKVCFAFAVYRQEFPFLSNAQLHSISPLLVFQFVYRII